MDGWMDGFGTKCLNRRELGLTLLLVCLTLDDCKSCNKGRENMIDDG
jgi:hypothetical protein